MGPWVHRGTWYRSADWLWCTERGFSFLRHTRLQSQAYEKAMYGGKVVGMPSAIVKGAEESQGGREICISSQTAEKKGMHF